MSSLDQYSPERIADRMRIQDVLHRWCRAIDRLDFDEMRAVFHPDAHDAHGIYNGGIDGLIEWIRERHKTIPFSMHQVSNVLIEFGSPEVAVCESYLRTIQRYPKEGAAALSQLAASDDNTEPVARDLWTSSRYVDRFEKRNGEWRIADRVLAQEWKLITPVPEPVPKNVPGSVLGRRDANDPIYIARARAGIGN